MAPNQSSPPKPVMLTDQMGWSSQSSTPHFHNGTGVNGVAEKRDELIGGIILVVVASPFLCLAIWKGLYILYRSVLWCKRKWSERVAWLKWKTGRGNATDGNSNEDESEQEQRRGRLYSVRSSSLRRSSTAFDGRTGPPIELQGVTLRSNASTLGDGPASGSKESSSSDSPSNSVWQGEQRADQDAETESFPEWEEISSRSREEGEAGVEQRIERLIALKRHEVRRWRKDDGEGLHAEWF